VTVLVLNCGSSSVKYQLVDPTRGGRVAGGQVAGIGTEVPDHDTALATVADEVAGHLDGAGPLVAVGHRVVHGGADLVRPQLVTDELLAAIDRLAVLAPLHNPANAQGIRSARASFPDVPQVAVFDTAFHATVPPAHRTYAVPREWEERFGVRRYGFHGTSHAYVSRRAAAWLAEQRRAALDESRVVVLHLGNGASGCAVLGGRSVDTSMGLTPLPGLVMGTRSGDVDPAVFGHLARVAGMGADEVEAALNTASGMRGLCGDSDMRAVVARAGAGDGAAQLALEVYAHRIRHYLGAYAVTLGGLDAVAFTGGVGERSPEVRELVLAGLDSLGIVLDPGRNEAVDRDGRDPVPVTVEGSPVAALVVPTDEEHEIATQTLSVVAAHGSGVAGP
jgi:acetate kinase